MPRSDSSGSSRKRRSTSRPTTAGKKSYGNKSSRPSRFDKGDDQSKPRFKRPSDDGEGKRSFRKPDQKFGAGGPSGFKKRDDKSSDSEKRSFGNSSGFKKRDDRQGGSFKRKPGDRDGKRSSGPRDKKFDSERSSEFRKDSSEGRFKRPSEGRDDKRSSGPRDRKFSSERPSGFKKDSGDNRFKGDRDDKRSSGPRDRKFNSERSSGFKKDSSEGRFKRPSDGRDEKRSFGGRDNKSSDRSSGFSRPSSRDEQSSDNRRSKFGREDGDRSSSSKRRRVESTSKSSASKKYEAEAPIQSDKVRLNKFIANSGVCSRREADELITMGLISVNGKTITELGYKVNPGDEVRYESKVLRSEKPVYVLMNKPKGYLTTTSDPEERNTVMHIIGNAVKERIYPVGRLDRNTTGLLVLTNDGDLADKLMHPSYNAKKIYKVDLDRPLTKADFERIVEGVQLEEGRAMVDDVAIISEDKKTVGLEIHIGWNRVVRRIFEALEYQVVKLDRSVYAGLDKKDLPRGHWRFLTQEEVVRLKHYTAAPKKSKA
jgi:23S rRNA pseudouridine2605 synthase